MISVSAEISMCPLRAKLLCLADREFYLGRKGCHGLSRLACRAHAVSRHNATENRLRVPLRWCQEAALAVSGLVVCVG